MATAIRVDTREVSTTLKRLPFELATEGRKALVKAGQNFDNGLRKSFRARSSPQDEWLQVRSGRLRNSIGYEVSGAGLSDLQLKVFSAGVPYANIQEYGGTIVPKRGRYLAIPTAANQTQGGRARGGAGVARFPSARAFIAEHEGETFFLRSKGGTGPLLLMWSKPDTGTRRRAKLGRGSKTRPVAMFTLVTKVTIPPRFGFRRTWDAQAPARFDLFKAAVQKALDRASGQGGIRG